MPLFTDLKNKTAMITGCGRRTGIGYAIAEKLALCGTHIILTDLGITSGDNNKMPPGIDREMLGSAADLKERFGVQTLACAMDVTCNDSIELALQAVRKSFDRIDLLFNNAGAVFGAPSTVHEYDENAWLRTIDVCLHGVFRVSKAVVPMMLGKQGAIINVSSRAGKSPPLWNPAYAVAKAGVIMLTRTMALDLAAENIRVNAICPGLIMTDLQELRIRTEAEVFGSSYEETKTRLANTVPMQRLGTAGEVADLAVYLASNQSSYITGQAVNIGGGLLMEV
jgi:NAD(P)-dependent dehydrogenase (short-subunit alcohol dehydrogenase family)